MNKILMSLMIFMLSSVVYSADIDKAKEITLISNQYVLPHQSSSPNKAVVFFSSRDDIDAYDYIEVLIDNADVTDGFIEITRPTATTLGRITLKSLESCSADRGKVTIQSNKLIVYTTQLPINVRCEGNSGEYREVYHTIFKP